MAAPTAAGNSRNAVAPKIAAGERPAPDPFGTCTKSITIRPMPHCRPEPHRKSEYGKISSQAGRVEHRGVLGTDVGDGLARAVRCEHDCDNGERMRSAPQQREDRRHANQHGKHGPAEIVAQHGLHNGGRNQQHR